MNKETKPKSAKNIEEIILAIKNGKMTRIEIQTLIKTVRGTKLSESVEKN